MAGHSPAVGVLALQGDVAEHLTRGAIGLIAVSGFHNLPFGVY